MRVLYISHCHPPEGADLKSIGGMQRVSRQLEYYLTREVEVTPLVLATSWTGIGIKTAFFLLRLLIRIPLAIHRHRPDIVLFSSMVTSGLAVVLRAFVNVPFVGIAHGQDVTMPVRLYQFWLCRVFRALSGVICVSHATRDACVERGLDPAKAQALGNGFDVRDMNDRPDRSTALKVMRSRFGLDGRPILLTVGRMVRRKGHEWFIRHVLSKINHDVQYLIIGDGPEWKAIRKAADETDTGGRIRMLGRQPDDVLKHAYVAADIFIMPNVPVPGDMEGFGVVLLEANLAGTPVIASDLEGIRDVVSNGINGWRIPPMNAQSFAAAVDNVLQSDLDALSKRASDHVATTFSWESVTRQYVRFLNDVMKSRMHEGWKIPYVPA